jgi:hypothetical protein
VHALEGPGLPYSLAKSGKIKATSKYLKTLEGHYAVHLLLRPNRLLAMSHSEVEIPALMSKLADYGANLNAYSTYSISHGEYQYYRR